MLELSRDGVTFYLHPESWSHLGVQRQYSAGWEIRETQFFQRFADSTKVAVDVGAWCGVHTVFLAKLFRHVYSFEPDRFAMKDLRLNVTANELGNVTGCGKALTDKDGAVVLNNIRGDSMASVKDVAGRGKSEWVGTWTWNTAVEELGIENVGLLKIDIEGAEDVLLPSMFQWLWEYKPPLSVAFHTELVEGTVIQRLRGVLEDVYVHVDRTERMSDLYWSE